MIILIIIAVLLVIILKLYNDLVKARNNVRQAKSGIDIYLNQRFDLIPNLVECVKGYSKHEKSIFTDNNFELFLIGYFLSSISHIVFTI